MENDEGRFLFITAHDLTTFQTAVNEVVNAFFTPVFMGYADQRWVAIFDKSTQVVLPYDEAVYMLEQEHEVTIQDKNADADGYKHTSSA